MDDKVLEALNAQTKYLHDIRTRAGWILLAVWIQLLLFIAVFIL